jgi:ketosteroid isomerase-like protein
MDEFLQWVRTTLHDAEVALHDGDAEPRLRTWSAREPVSVLGAAYNALGRAELEQLFGSIAGDFSDVVSFDYEIVAHDVIGDVAWTAGFEHTSCSVRGEPRTYTLRVTQTYRREDGEWHVAHRHADPLGASPFS